MAATYEIRVRHPASGETLAILSSFASLAYARAANAVGRLTLALPRSVDYRLFGEDMRLEVWRGVDGRAPQLEMGATWFVRRRTRTLDLLTVEAVDQIDLLRRRIVAYAAGSAQAEQVSAADDMIKQIVRDNYGASATDSEGDTTRALSTAYLSIQANTSAAPSINKAFARREVLTVLQEIAAASATLGTYLAFDLQVYAIRPTLELRTYTGQRGTDRRVSSGGGLTIAMEAGPSSSAQLVEDWTGEASYIYAGGQGQGDDRLIRTASDPARLAASPWNRIERMVSATQASAPATVLAAARAELRRARAVRVLEGRLVDRRAARYGVDYGYGDYVTVGLEGETGEARLDAIGVTVNADHTDTVEALVRVEEGL